MGAYYVEFDLLEVYVVKMKVEGEIKIGRGSDCDIKITDISVSRFHATLRLQNKRIILKDYKSKFGTLYKARSQVIDFKEVEQKIVFQLGRSIISM